ncbi:MFS transporter [Aquella oligotrophica]|uniref:Major facilitator superfamily (MFS) profile domain-containing protein n=1 Tax=Aquella oligotrophica TaxID=2067065 RepID=A0A2I7N3E6_9NEIS|nr:MFS transporter [Aquella oligotrophica]AUR50981.1 hypothetical protein CUN60_01225 [Aquella oligotrophica]
MNQINHQKSSGKLLSLVFLTIFIDMLGVGVLIPVFPLLIIQGSEFNIVPIGWSNAQAMIMAGWLLAIYPLSQFIFTPILGQLSDHYGRRKLLALSIFGTSISYLLFAIAIHSKNLPLMFFSRFIDGASGGNISIAQAVIGDISKPDKRARNFGLIGVSIGIGFVFGPFIGGKLSDPELISWFGAATPFEFTTLLSFVNALLVLYLLPETLQIRNTRTIDYLRSIHNIIGLSANLQLRKLIFSLFLFNAGFTFFSSFWGVVLQEVFEFKQGQVGNYFAYIGVMIILAQGGLVRRLSGKIAEYKVLPIAMTGMAACLFVNYIIPSNQPNLIYYVPPFIAVCAALCKAFGSALITKVSEPDKLGEAMGINSSANALGQAIPYLLAGYVAASHARLPVLVGAILTIFAALFFFLHFKSFKIIEAVGK